MFPFGLIQNDKFTGSNVPNKKTETEEETGNTRTYLAQIVQSKNCWKYENGRDAIDAILKSESSTSHKSDSA